MSNKTKECCNKEYPQSYEYDARCQICGYLISSHNFPMTDTRKVDNRIWHTSEWIPSTIKNYCSDCGEEISKDDCAYNVCNNCRIEL